MVTVDDGVVRVDDGQKIGSYLLTDNTLKSIEIYPPYQDEGFGKSVIMALCDALEPEYDALYIACVSNPALEHILSTYGGYEVSSHELPIAGHGMLDGEYPDYKIDL